MAVIAVGVYVWQTRGPFSLGGVGTYPAKCLILGDESGVGEWLPQGGEVEVVHHRYYSLGYCEDWEQAAWVVERLKPEMLIKGNERTDDFREDPLVSTRSASPADYQRSGYDRGHLAPAADFSFDKLAVSESFFMSNMSPQTPNLNRYAWRDIESWVRKVVKRERDVVVVTGPIVGNKPKRIGKNQVAVPQAYFKAILDLTPPRKMIAFVYPNAKSVQNKPAMYVRKVDYVEDLTKLDLFATLPDEEENALESEARISEWSY